MSGPSINFDKAWGDKVGSGIKLDEHGELDHFLGCRHVRREITRNDGKKITIMEYDVECSLRASIAKYKALAKECGVDVKVEPRPTPYRREPVHEHGAPPQGGPMRGLPMVPNGFCSRPVQAAQMREGAWS